MLESIVQGPTAFVLTFEQKRMFAQRDMDGVKNEKSVLKIASIHALQLIHPPSTTFESFCEEMCITSNIGQNGFTGDYCSETYCWCA